MFQETHRRYFKPDFAAQLKPLRDSDTLQDLIEILQQNYISECSHSPVGKHRTVCSICGARSKRTSA